MARNFVIERKLSANVKIMWLMPQIALVLLIWFIGATFGLFATHEMMDTIAPGVNHALTVFLLLAGLTGLIMIPSYLWAEVEHNAYSYQLDEHGIAVRWGVINRHRTVIPYDKIQDVKTERTVLERILGLVTLNIETAGRSMQALETASIVGISINEREGLISDIMANVVMKRGEIANGSYGTYDKTLLTILNELKEISIKLKEEIGEIKEEMHGMHKLEKRRG